MLDLINMWFCYYHIEDYVVVVFLLLYVCDILLINVYIYCCCFKSVLFQIYLNEFQSFLNSSFFGHLSFFTLFRCCVV